MTETEDDEEEDEGRLAWDPEVIPLPAELGVCLARVKAGDRLPLAAVLSDIPLFQGLKVKAEENNHAQDARSQGDRWLRGIQQRLIQVQRLIAALYCLQQAGEDSGTLLQQLFLAAESEWAILQERTRRSIPGCVPQT